MTLAGTVSNDFAEYVLLCFKHAQDRHDRQARGETLPVLEPVKGYPEEFESRLVIVLLKVLPDIIKTPALETDENRQGIGSLRLLEELYLRVRPGGLEEQQTLVKFLRNLSPAASAREAIDVLRRWRLAKNRVSALALPEIPAYEQVKGIMTMLRTLERKYDALKTRLALVRIHPDIQLGKPSGITHLLDTVEQELRRLSADETTKDNLNQVNEPMIAKGKGDKGTGKGHPGPKTVEARRHVLCPCLDKPGGCSFGDRCHYKHDKPGKPHPKPKPKPKAEPKKKCIFHNRKNGCKLGFKCKFLHEGPSGATAQADDDGPESTLVGGDAQQAKAKPKPKAKASAASSFACMFRASTARDARNHWPYLYLPNWNVHVCDLTREQFLHWRDNPDVVAGNFRQVSDSNSWEIDAWLNLRGSYMEDDFGENPIQIRGDRWIVDVGLATTWCQDTSHHEPVFLAHTLDHQSAEEHWMAITQAPQVPGTSQEEITLPDATLGDWQENSDVSQTTPISSVCMELLGALVH